MAKTTPPLAPGATKTAPIRVRALREGFAFGNRVRKGMTFTLPDMSHFTERWMKLVDPATPDELAAKIAPKGKRVATLGQRTKSGTIVHAAPQAGEALPAAPGADLTPADPQSVI